jgi:hypothetical protein
MRHDWHGCMHFTIDVADAQWSILTLALRKQCGMIDMDACILRLMWPMPHDRFQRSWFVNHAARLTWVQAFYDQCGRGPLIDSDAHAWQTMWHDWHGCTNFTIDKADAQWSILTHALRKRSGFIDMDAHILRSMWSMHNDQFWHSCFRINVTDPWW